MSQSISVTVLLFAAVADAAGRRRVDLQLPPGATLDDAVQVLVDQYPGLLPWLDRVSYARNLEITTKGARLADGDEIALLPPVSGGDRSRTAGGSLPRGSGDGTLLVTTEPLSLDAAQRLVSSPYAGATCVFAGTVREFTGSHQTSYLEYDVYPDMAIKVMEQLKQEMESRWPRLRVAFHHRVGRLEIGEVSVVVAVSAPHRDEAFTAGRFGIDELKRRLPVWKKEVYADGSHWVGSDGSTPGDEAHPGR